MLGYSLFVAILALLFFGILVGGFCLAGMGIRRRSRKMQWVGFGIVIGVSALVAAIVAAPKKT